MYFKRFAQLFIIFLVASAILSAIFATNFTGSWLLTWLLATIVAYLILVLPLVFLTLAKAHKKADIVGSQSATGELAELLKGLPGYIAFSTGRSTTIMSFTQSTKSDNVLYMVADPATTKVKELQDNPCLSFTTWFDSLEKGARLSSNRMSAEVLMDSRNRSLIEQEPNILSVHENAANMVIIKLTLHSALYEDFKDGLRALTFK